MNQSTVWHCTNDKDCRWLQDLPLGGVVMDKMAARDVDAGINALVEYRVVDSGAPSGTFRFQSLHQPILTLHKPLDYETSSRYLVTVVASDRAFKAEQRLSSTVTLTVMVGDVDDEAPIFRYNACPLNSRGQCPTPTYTATVLSGMTSGLLTVKPERIQAMDTESKRAEIRYSLSSESSPDYASYFEIHPLSGYLRQIRTVNRSQIQLFNLTVKAEEVTEKKSFATASLIISVEDADLHAPRLVADASEGFVEENSAVGTLVTTVNRNGQPLQLRVVDDDLGQKDVSYQYQIELTTSAFRVDSQGFLQVNVPNLDRDQPNPSTLTFHATARQLDGRAPTSPLAISIRLIDVNDNSPKFKSMKRVLLPAGDSKRIVTQVQAEDNDWADNGRLLYSITSVSRNGRNQFTIHPETGIIDAVGALNVGERYTITVQATDGGGRSSQGFVDVVIVAGPNTLPPIFARGSYDLPVSEGIPIGTTITTIQAKDPENEEISYSIVAGNTFDHFKILKSNGTLLVNGLIDREELSRYTLTVKAEDPAGLSAIARLHIRVVDINDKNPEFVDLPYSFSVKENDLTGYIGRVHAKDGDIELNGQISYALASDSIFKIDAQTGEISSKAALDYEKDRVHRIVVTARDKGVESRLATATVTIIVTDLPDENPKFTQTNYEVSVPENNVDFFVAQVQASDMDSKASVTYAIRNGDTSKFHIDAQSGTVRTKEPLDYERQTRYVLTIATLENTDLDDPQATTTLIVNVQDRNDISPVFTSIPKPVRLSSNVPSGHNVATVVASDLDGSSPNNFIRYEIVGSAKANRFFRVNSETGLIQTKDDLRKDFEREYKVEVLAYDLGKPALSSTATVTVAVEHIVSDVPLDWQMNFSDMAYSVSVSEDALVNTLVKNISVVNKPTQVVPISCQIISGNENDVFYISNSGERSCELRLKRSLDYEVQPSYAMVVELKTLANVINQDRITAKIDISVVDVNDNAPKFVFKYPNNVYTNGKYYAAIAMEAPISSILLQVQAEDKDSGALGQVTYEILDETNSGKYFSIERTTGTIRNDRMINIHQLPLRLIVVARDNPGQPKGYQETSCQVVVNVLDRHHRLVMVLPSTSPDQVHRSQSSIVGVIHEETKLIVRVEKLQARSFVSPNGSLHLDPSGSELWFYCIDPDTETILSNNHSKIIRSIVSSESMKHLIDLMAMKTNMDVSEIRPPLILSPFPSRPAGSTNPFLFASLWDGFPAALIVIAVIVFLLALVGIIYICVTWDRYKLRTSKPLQPYVVFPQYNPVIIDPNPKEYETQIMQLNVTNSTDGSESSGHLKMDFHPRRNHAFPLAPSGFANREVSYSSENKSPSSSMDSDIATLRISSLAGNGGCEFTPNQFLNQIPAIPTSNPIYEGHQARTDGDPFHFACATNTNVTFRSKLAKLGIPEVSTEL